MRQENRQLVRELAAFRNWRRLDHLGIQRRTHISQWQLFHGAGCFKQDPISDDEKDDKKDTPAPSRAGVSFVNWTLSIGQAAYKSKFTSPIPLRAEM